MCINRYVCIQIYYTHIHTATSGGSYPLFCIIVFLLFTYLFLGVVRENVGR